MNYEKESERLRFCVARSGQSKDAIAVQMHSSKANLYNWTNPKKPHFPDPFQLDLLCKYIDADPWFILTGDYENLMLRHLSGLNLEESLAARGVLANFLMMVLSVPGADPELVEDSPRTSHEESVNQAREQFRAHIDKKWPEDGITMLGEEIGNVRKVKRWFHKRNPEGFPDPKSFVQICQILGIKFSDVIRNDPANDFEQLLKGFDKKELKAAKELAATTMRGLYR